jgi:hypothetical protein
LCNRNCGIASLRDQRIAHQNAAHSKTMTIPAIARRCTAESRKNEAPIAAEGCGVSYW